jgi:MYND finger
MNSKAKQLLVQLRETFLKNGVRCKHCSAQHEHAQAMICSQCTTVAYCNAQCQSRDWNTHASACLIQGQTKRDAETDVASKLPSKRQDTDEDIPIATLNKDTLRIIALETGFESLQQLALTNKAMYEVWKYVATKKYWWRMPSTKEEFNTVIDSLIDPKKERESLWNVIISRDEHIYWLVHRGLWEGIRNMRLDGDIRSSIYIPRQSPIAYI